MPARMHSRTIRRTAMMPPWPVSPSMITGNFTDCAIHPATVTHSSMVRRADVGEPGVGPDHATGAHEADFAPGLLHDPRAGGVRRMQDRQHAVGSIDQLPQSASSVEPRSQFHRSNALQDLVNAPQECIAIIAPQLTPSSVSNYGASINEMMFHCMERRRSCSRHRPRPRVSTTSDIVIEAVGVNHAYEGQDGWVNALENFEIAIPRNEFLCLLGPSGCGKSSFLRIVTGLMKADGGRSPPERQADRGAGTGSRHRVPGARLCFLGSRRCAMWRSGWK